jgi:hypothetical protein
VRGDRSAARFFDGKVNDPDINNMQRPPGASSNLAAPGTLQSCRYVGGL